MQIPLFPLSTVLFPGGPLPLRIFETRYVDMIGDRMRKNAPFGVVLIREGTEAGEATTFAVGTLARITDFYQGSDGLLGVTAIGGQRFRITTASRQSDGLKVAEVELIPDEQRTPLSPEYRPLADMLSGVLDDLGRLYADLDRELDDTGWVTHRFLEILPIDLGRKQHCLEQGDPVARMRLVQEALNVVRGPAEDR